MAKSPKNFFRVEDLPKGFHLQDPSHLRQEDLLTLWDFLTSRQKDGQVGLMFSGCDPRDKRQDMGKGLSWKAKGKRPNLAGDDQSSSSSDNEDSGDESLEDEVWADMGSLTKGRGKSADPKYDHNNTARLHMGDPDSDQGSLGMDAPDQVDLTEFVTNIQAPANAGDSKEEKLLFLAALSERDEYQAKVQWLTDNLVLYSPLL